MSNRMKNDSWGAMIGDLFKHLVLLIRVKWLRWKLARKTRAAARRACKDSANQKD